MLTLGMSPREIMLGFTAKVGEPLSGARQFPTHGAYPELGLINLSNVIATQLPQAVGAVYGNSNAPGRRRLSSPISVTAHRASETRTRL